METKKGFTLIEILVVVVILGILAAILIPQFADASSQAKEARLSSDLSSVRSQIELYKVHHNDNLPGTQGSIIFETAMTSYTRVDGSTAAGPGVGIYGPYLPKLPVNPYNLDRTVTEGILSTIPADDSSGWYFNTSSGAFNANDSGTSLDGTAHSEL